jgi:hypothetical protein
MDSLPFTLKVPGKDDLTVTTASSTWFRFHGFLHLTPEELRLDWTGTAKVEAVSLLEVKEETVVLPDETLTLPLSRVRELLLKGGWWRPRLEMAGNDLDALRMVPSEERGRVRLWLARRDLQQARELVARFRELRF